MRKLVVINGVKKELSISIDNESLDIYVDNGDQHEPTHICYWHLDEVVEDAEVSISMINAVKLYYTEPQKLINILSIK